MIEISNEQNIYEYTDEITDMIEKAIKRVLEFEAFKMPCEVNVIVTDNANIQEINYAHRKIDRATDVLSFPMLSYKNGVKVDQNTQDDINPETGDVMLGDIVVSLEKAHEQAEEYGHGFSREIAFLVVHSMLHLLGYDHEEIADCEIMRKKEEEILKGMGLQR